MVRRTERSSLVSVPSQREHLDRQRFWHIRKTVKLKEPNSFGHMTGGRPSRVRCQVSVPALNANPRVRGQFIRFDVIL